MIRNVLFKSLKYEYEDLVYIKSVTQILTKETGNNMGVLEICYNLNNMNMKSLILSWRLSRRDI